MLGDARPSYFALRLFLVVDATLLFVLGLALLFVPDRARLVFHFATMPTSVTYMLGLLGCVFFTLGIGYAIAATDPLHHIAWIWVGIARALLETLFGVICIARGLVTWQQAGFGIVIAGLVAITYALLYPRGGLTDVV
jgi:hypothetical protein